MKNKVFTVTVYNGKTVRIIFSEKLQTYFVEINDLKRLFNMTTKEFPEKYKGKLNYINIKINNTSKKLAGIAEEDLNVIKNFSKLQDADNYANSILTIIENIKMSYSGFTRGMVLSQDEQDFLIGDYERKVRKINILEGEVAYLKEGAKIFFEFTDNTSLIPTSCA